MKGLDGLHRRWFRLAHQRFRLDRGPAGEEHGAVVLMVVVMTTILFTIAALVVDLGQARVLRREAQAASDSSALAAMNAMYLSGTPIANITGPGGAVEAAKAYAAANYGITDADWASCDDPAPLTYQPLTGTTDCISFDDDTQPTTARVVAPVRTVEFTFSTLFGASEIGISAGAEATMLVDKPSECGLCLVGGGDHHLQNGKATVWGGDIAINGNVDVNSNGLVATDGAINVEGDATGDGYSEPLYEGQPPIDDPLANYPLPPDHGALSVQSDPCSDGPGIYGNYTFDNESEPCTLDPGLYVVTGTWAFSGNSGMDADGVTLYFTCGTTTAPIPCPQDGQDGGSLDAVGNGTINISAPLSGPTQGLAVAYDRLNTSEIELSGNGAGSIVGTIYALSATMVLNGNGCSSNHSLIVVDSLSFTGAPSCLESHYDMAENVPMPPRQLHLSE